MGASLLLIEDTASLAELYAATLRGAGHSVTIAPTGTEGLAQLAREDFAALILDLHLPDRNGLEVLRQLRQDGFDLPVVVATAHGSIHVAVEAMRAGAYDFLVKPFPPAKLVVAVDNALAVVALRHEVRDLRRATAQTGFQGFIGAAPAMQVVYRTIEALASSRASIFITGESGTGKELAAAAIHRLSPRRAKALVPINCAAIPRELLEAELFGSMKGAFTGAVDRPGAAQLADGGTLFLDEVCEMPPELQPKLLRFLQSGQAQQLGSTRSQPVDVRVIAATNRDPATEVAAGRFREDLYYRLQVIPLELPPLREREDDVILLAAHFLRQAAREEGKDFRDLHADAITALRAHGWPGNVRELQNIIRRAVVLHMGSSLRATMLDIPAGRPAPGRPGASPGTPAPPPLTTTIRPLWQIEQEAILAALRLTQDDVPQAAALLGVSPSTIYRKKQAWADAG